MSGVLQIIGIVIITLASANFGKAQMLMPVIQFSGNQMQVAGPMAMMAGGEILISGINQGLATWPTQNLAQYGGRDIFLSCYDPATEALRWTISGGSAEDDGVSAIATDPMNNTLIAGFSFGNFLMEQLHLEGNLAPNPKLLFMVKVSPLGDVLNGWYIQGTEEYALTDLASDNQGNWIICGHFKGALFLPDTTLLSQSQSDMFLVKFDSDGQMLWVVQEGRTGITRPLAMALDDEGNVICGGIFDRNTQIAGQELEAASNDRDGFLAKYDGSGSGIWSRKIGGVQDDDLIDVEINALGEIFTAGYFRGVLSLGGSINLQTENGDPDFFLLKFNGNGLPQAGISFGSTEINLAKDIFISGDRILFSGLFQGVLSMEGRIWDSGPVFAGFFGLFDHNLAFLQGYAASATEGLSPSGGVMDMSGSAWLSMSFAGSAEIGNSMVQSTGDFDGLLAKNLIGTSDEEVAPPGNWVIFPNPVTDIIYVQGWQPGDMLQLIDLKGKILRTASTVGQIKTDNLPQGIYLLNCSRAGLHETFKILKYAP